jgi:hypothetical protein
LINFPVHLPGDLTNAAFIQPDGFHVIEPPAIPEGTPTDLAKNHVMHQSALVLNAPGGIVTLPGGDERNLGYEDTPFLERMAIDQWLNDLENVQTETAFQRFLNHYGPDAVLDPAGSLFDFAQREYERTGEYPGYHYTSGVLMSVSALNPYTFIKGFRALRSVATLRTLRNSILEGAKTGGGSYHLALGLAPLDGSETVYRWAERMGFRDFRTTPAYAGARNPSLKVIGKAIKEAEHVHFRLDGFDIPKFRHWLANGAKLGPRTVTMWELKQVLMLRGAGGVTFWLNDIPVQGPMFKPL